MTKVIRQATMFALSVGELAAQRSLVLDTEDASPHTR